MINIAVCDKFVDLVDLLFKGYVIKDVTCFDKILLEFASDNDNHGNTSGIGKWYLFLTALCSWYF